MIAAPDSVRTNYNRINKSPDTTLGGCGAELRLTLCRLGPIYGQVLLGPAPQLPRVFCVYGIGAQPPTGASVPFTLLKAPLGGPGRLRIKKGCRCSVSGDGVAYPQNRHQGRTGAALRAVWANSRCNWLISPARVVNCASRLSIRAFSSSTNVPSLVPPSGGGALGGVGGVTGGKSARSTTQTKPWGVSRLYPLITPLVNRRLIVWVDTCKAAAASVIDTSIVFSLSSWLINRVSSGYAVITRFDEVPA